jgi:AGCS family alanine or glycine:cation symporter
MYYIKNGLDGKWVWLGTAFAIFGALAGFGIGNTVQAKRGLTVKRRLLQAWPLAPEAIFPYVRGVLLE